MQPVSFSLPNSEMNRGQKRKATEAGNRISVEEIEAELKKRYILAIRPLNSRKHSADYDPYDPLFTAISLSNWDCDEAFADKSNPAELREAVEQCTTNLRVRYTTFCTG